MVPCTVYRTVASHCGVRGFRMQKQRAPDVNRMLEWINRFLSSCWAEGSSKRVDQLGQLCTGVHYCQIFSVLLCGALQMDKLNWEPRREMERRGNLQLLEDAFARHGVDMVVPVIDISCETKPDVNLRFLEWVWEYAQRWPRMEEPKPRQQPATLAEREARDAGPTGSAYDGNGRQITTIELDAKEAQRKVHELTLQKQHMEARLLQLERQQSGVGESGDGAPATRAVSGALSDDDAQKSRRPQMWDGIEPVRTLGTAVFDSAVNAGRANIKHSSHGLTQPVHGLVREADWSPVGVPRGMATVGREMRLADQRLIHEARVAGDELEHKLNAQIHAQTQMMEELPRLEASIQHYRDKMWSIQSVCELHRELPLAAEVAEITAMVVDGAGTL